MLVYVDGENEIAIGELEGIFVSRNGEGERELVAKLQGRETPVVVLRDLENFDGTLFRIQEDLARRALVDRLLPIMAGERDVENLINALITDHAPGIQSEAGQLARSEAGQLARSACGLPYIGVHSEVSPPKGT